MNTALELAGVSAGYGHQLVIRDVSLTVNEGELAALIGPNEIGRAHV